MLTPGTLHDLIHMPQDSLTLAKESITSKDTVRAVTFRKICDGVCGDPNHSIRTAS